jgi:hypothetical protein
MSWINKKQNNTEVCGFLDRKGKFYESRKNRDEADYEILLRELKEWKVDEYDAYIRYMGRYDYESHSMFHQLQIIVDKLGKESMTKFIDINIKYLEDVEKLNTLYNK